MVPPQALAPVYQLQPMWALHAAAVVWLAHACTVPLQLDVPQVQPYSPLHEVCVAFALHGVTVPRQLVPPFVHVHAGFDMHPACVVNPGQLGLPTQVVPLYVQSDTAVQLPAPPML
jgi:hypothetical protein